MGVSPGNLPSTACMHFLTCTKPNMKVYWWDRTLRNTCQYSQ